MIASWPRPRVLEEGYLARILVLRLCLVCLASITLDATLAARDHGSSWGWAARAGMLGMLVPLLLNVVGLVWPFLQLETFEAHYQSLNQAIVYASVAGKLLEGLSSASSAASSCQQSMLLQGVLFIVHQDPIHQFLPLLAVMLAAYTACHLCGATGALLKGPTASSYGVVSSSRSHLTAAAASAAADSWVPGALAGDLLAVTTAGEFCLNTFMLVLVLYRLYHMYIGPREQPPAVAAASRHAGHACATGKASSAAPWGVAGSRSAPKQRRASAVGGPQLGLSRAYLLKLAVVQGTNACFVLLYALQYQQATSIEAATGAYSSAASGWVLWPQLPALVGVIWAGVLLCHALCGFCAPKWYQRHMALVNTAASCTCTAARLFLVWVHGWGLEHAQGRCPGCVGVASAPGVSPDHVFHSFLMLVFSLSVNEDTLPVFAAQLCGAAVLFRWVHLQLLGAGPPAPGALMCWLELPEYVVVTSCVMLVYRWLCVGRWEQPQPVAAAGAWTAGQVVPTATPRSKRIRRSSKQSVPSSISIEQPTDSLAILGRDQMGAADQCARQQRRRVATPRRSRTFSNPEQPLRQHLSASAATGVFPTLSTIAAAAAATAAAASPGAAVPSVAEAQAASNGRQALRPVPESSRTSGATRASLPGLPTRRMPSVDIRHVSKTSFELPLPTSPSTSSSEELSSTRLQALIPPHQQQAWLAPGQDEAQQQEQEEEEQQQQEQVRPQQQAPEGQPQSSQQFRRTATPTPVPGLHLLSSLYSSEPDAAHAANTRLSQSSDAGSSSTSPGAFISPLESGGAPGGLGTLPLPAFSLSSIAEGPGTPTEPQQPPLTCGDTGSSEDAAGSNFSSSSSGSGSDSGSAPKQAHQQPALAAAVDAGSGALAANQEASALTAGPSSDPSWWSWGAKSAAASTTVRANTLSSSGPSSADSLLVSDTSALDSSSSRSSGSYSWISRNGPAARAGMSLAGTLEQLEQQQQQQDPAVLQRQRVACDAMMCLLELPVQMAHAPRLLLTALYGSTSAGLAWPCRLLGGAGVLLYMLGGFLHLLYLVRQPAAALQRRCILWPVRVCLAPALLRVVQAVLQVEASWPARRGLLVLSSCMGLLDLPVRVLAAWLPLMAVVYFTVHAWSLWQARSWALLAFDAVEFNLAPLICYASTKAAVALMQWGLDTALPWLQGLLQAVVRWLDEPSHRSRHQRSHRQRRTSRIGNGHHQQQLEQQQSTPPTQQRPWHRWLEGVLVVAGAAGSQLVVSVVLMWVLLKGPLQLPSGRDPWAALEGAKAILSSMLERMGLHILTQTKQETAQLLLALTGIALSFLVVSGLQALVLSAAAWRDPRRQAYQAAKAQVFTLGERTMTSLALLDEGAGAAEIDTVLLSTIEEVTAGCFPNCSLVLVLLEEASLGSCAVQRHVIHATPELAGLPKVATLPLAALPSVEAACKERHVIFKSDVAKAAAGYSDWQELVDERGQTTFLVVPLSFAHRTLGALLVTSKSPVSLNKYLRKLAVELSFALAQILYTRLCIEQLRAGNEIINDVLPQPVAEHLRRRVISARSASLTLSFSGMDQAAQQQKLAQYWQQPLTPQGHVLASRSNSGGLVPDSPHQGLLSRLSEAASALRSQQQQLQQAGGSQQQQVQPRLPYSERSAFGVAYKSWHPHVTVLFADIAGYTAMSTDVEPEAVMLLLHELFSKYDHLCTQYGIYKVETIGDCYMACSGVLVDNPQHAQHMVQFGCAMLAVAASVQSPLGGSVRVRVGIHSGRVMSGIVGNIRARYCLFGDTVNTASRMESTGIVDRVQISEDTYRLLGSLQSDFEPREAVMVKGKGVMQTYVLRGKAAERLRAEGLLLDGSAAGMLGMR